MAFTVLCCLCGWPAWLQGHQVWATLKAGPLQVVNRWAFRCKGPRALLQRPLAGFLPLPPVRPYLLKIILQIFRWSLISQIVLTVPQNVSWPILETSFNSKCLFQGMRMSFIELIGHHEALQQRFPSSSVVSRAFFEISCASVKVIFSCMTMVSANPSWISH